KIRLGDRFVDHPLEANIWQLPTLEQADYLEAIANAGCNSGTPMPEKFIEWIYWKLGDVIADNYMIPYNRKMFGDNLEQLGTYWLEKLPSVSFRETLLSCLNRKAYGKQPAHAEFYYPKKFGYGELWSRMAASISDRIEYNKKVCSIDFDSHVVKTDDGSSYKADKIITTIPWLEFRTLNGMPDALKSDIGRLKHTAVQIKYFPTNLEGDAHWSYFPDPSVSYHRILYRHNWHSDWKGHWTETRAERVSGALEDGKTSFLNPYAYPLNTIDKPKIMRRLLDWCKLNNVYGLGRWGEHSHYNSDVVVRLAMSLAEKI
ncbi:MAG: FAD-dependent oxidoreductase, partial [Selenomonadaceae bacterium]|nr:FAD-dependent oxidoreductase [Selenomonadaceae bacterium]